MFSFFGLNMYFFVDISILSKIKTQVVFFSRYKLTEAWYVKMGSVSGVNLDLVLHT